MSLRRIAGLRKSVIMCSLGVFVCTAAKGQNEPAAAVNQVIKKFLGPCPSDQPLSHIGTYYLEVTYIPKLYCADVSSSAPQACKAVISYDRASFTASETLRSPADLKNKVEWKGYIQASYETVQVRHIADGVWGQWRKAADNPRGPRGIYNIFKLSKEDGKWVSEPGDDLLEFTLGLGLSNVEKPSCPDIQNDSRHTGASVQSQSQLPPPSSLPVAPGHLLNDTYAQAQAIAQANASNGIRDSINPSYLKARLPLTICFSVDATGNCRKSGETIWLPGDLAKPLDWNRFSQTGACRPPQPDQIEVVLKSTPHDDTRKRYIRCVPAGILASVRKDLMDLGVKDDASTGRALATPPLPNAPRTVPQSSPSAPGSNALEIAAGKNAVTTRAFPDPRGKGPGCEIPEGTQVLVQSVDKQTGKTQLLVLPNGRRDSKTCTNFLTVDRSDLRGIAGYPTPK